MISRLSKIFVVAFSLVMLAGCGGAKDITGSWTATHNQEVDLSYIGVDEFSVAIDATFTFSDEDKAVLVVEWNDESVEEFTTILGDIFTSQIPDTATEEEIEAYYAQLESMLGCTVDEYLETTVEATKSQSYQEVKATYKVDGDTVSITNEDGEVQKGTLVGDDTLEVDELTFTKN